MRLINHDLLSSIIITVIIREVKQYASDLSAAEGEDMPNKQIRSRKNSKLSRTTEDDRLAKFGLLTP